MTVVAEYEIGPLGYRIKREGKRFTLWLGGCRIGRPRADKPGEIWEYAATTATAAAEEMETDARERLRRKIAETEALLNDLMKTDRALKTDHYPVFRIEVSK